MSMDAGGLAHMNFNNPNASGNGAFTNSNGLGLPGAGFGARGSRINSKRLSVALPPKVNPISENAVDNPTPRTSRSHLLAGLRTQPKTPAVPASAPYNQTQHNMSGLGASRWANQSYDTYTQGVPHTANGATFDLNNQYGMTAGRQMYSLPEQVLAPPSFYEQGEEMDPNVLQQMQMTSLFLAQRQQQLQQQLASITAAATTSQLQAMNLNGAVQRNTYQQQPMTPQNNAYGQQQQQQQQLQSPIEVQPGLYLVYNPAIQGYSYAYDQSLQQQAHATMSPSHQTQAPAVFGLQQHIEVPPPSVSVSSPVEKSRSLTPPKKSASPPSALDNVEPLPPPSANAFRRGHKKSASLAINPVAGNVVDGMKTSSAATFGSQRSVFPPTPMTGTFGPGAARAGEHPVRQPRGPPQLEELTTAPTSKHEGSKNFATRQRRRALDNLMKAGTFRRVATRSVGGSPASEGEFNFSISEEPEDFGPVSASSSRKMSPIGSEMKEKRNSQGSSDGYFGLSSASSSEGEDSIFKQPATPATPVGSLGGLGGDRKKMLGGLLDAAEKRRNVFM